MNMSEKTMPIRVPSTANLMIDSFDRVVGSQPSAWDFQITKLNSIMNGFFTRIGTTEVVLEWCENNITAANNTMSLDLSGTGANSFAGPVSVTVTPSFYTVAQLLDQIVLELNAQTGSTGATWSVLQQNALTPTLVSLDCSGALITAVPTGSLFDLVFEQIVFDDRILPVLSCVDLRPYRYIDFVSAQLTYNQDLKDNSTAKIIRDVLCRWYFADDVPAQLDAYGFPILMGYAPFKRRRLYNPPKQIKWDSRQPIGNIAFQVYDDAGDLLPTSDPKSNFLMTLQLSEA